MLVKEGWWEVQPERAYDGEGLEAMIDGADGDCEPSLLLRVTRSFQTTTPSILK